MPVGSFPAHFEHISDIHEASYCTLAQLKENRAKLDPSHDAEKERLNRKSIIVLLRQLARELKLNPWVEEDALVFVGRFFACRSYERNDRFLFAAAAIYLAAKLRDCPRSAKHVAIAFFRVRYANKPSETAQLDDPRNADKKLAEYGLIEALVDAERALLYTLNFNVRDYYVQTSLKHYLTAANIYTLANPPKSPGPVLNDFSMATQKLLTQVANNFCRDILKTQLFLQFPPERAAAACTRLAAEHAKVQFTPPTDEMLLSPDLKLGPQFKLSDSDYECFKEQIMQLYQSVAEVQPAAGAGAQEQPQAATGPAQQQPVANGPAPAQQEQQQPQQVAKAAVLGPGSAIKPAAPPSRQPTYSRPPPAPAMFRPTVPRTHAPPPDGSLQADAGSPSDPTSANENNNNNTTPACDDAMAETTSTQHAASLEPGELPGSPDTVLHAPEATAASAEQQQQQPSSQCNGTQPHPKSEAASHGAGGKADDASGSHGIEGPLNGYIQPRHVQQHMNRKRRAEEDGPATCSDDTAQRESKTVRVA